MDMPESIIFFQCVLICQFYTVIQNTSFIQTEYIMKKVQLLLLVCLMAFAVVAQVPSTINYQAVARNNAGAALANQSIQVRLSILSGPTSLYSETRSVTTNALGLFNVQIGAPGATTTTGSMAGISWSNNQPNAKKIKVELDITNTNIFTDMGTQDLATVPYAFSSGEAINAINIGGNYVSTSTPQLNDILQWNGSAWVPIANQKPKVFSYAHMITPVLGGVNTNWNFVNPTLGTRTITVEDGQTISAAFSGSFVHMHPTLNLGFGMDICYQLLSGGTIYSFAANDWSDYSMPPGTGYKHYSVAGGASVITGSSMGTNNVLPPGTYKIGLGIRNYSTSGTPITFQGDRVTGFVQVN
jgi:hypothetical protein